MMRKAFLQGAALVMRSALGQRPRARIGVIQHNFTVLTSKQPSSVLSRKYLTGATHTIALMLQNLGRRTYRTYFRDTTLADVLKCDVVALEKNIPHSYRNATIGSTREARRAGRMQAARPDKVRRAATPVNVHGSVGTTPQS